MRLMAGASYVLGAVLLHVFFHLLVIHFADKLNRGSEGMWPGWRLPSLEGAGTQVFVPSTQGQARQ